jgi:hypothetical protein
MRIASAAIVVLCAAGVAGVLGWTPSSMGGAPKPNQLTAPLQPGDPNGQARPLQAPNGNTRATRCGDCGVVESMREIADPSERAKDRLPSRSSVRLSPYYIPMPPMPPMPPMCP